MPSRVYVSRKWNGPEYMVRFRRATGRGTIGITERIAADTREGTHVISNDLRNSVHAAIADTGGEQRPISPEDVLVGIGTAMTEVGSWLDYACAEWVGRGHDALSPAVQAASAYSTAVMFAAFKAERL